jgi:uncharacterized protein (DUF885 family)
MNRCTFATCTLLLALLVSHAAAATPMGERLNTLLEAFDQQDLELTPMAAVLRGDLRHADQFGDLISDDFHRRAEANAREQLARLATIDRAQLGAKERVAFDMFGYQARFALRQYDEGHVKFAKQLPIDPIFSPQITFAQFSSGTAGAPYRTLADYDNGLARIDGFVIWLDRAIGRMREGIRDGRVQPRHVIEKIIAQLDEALAQAPEASPYWRPIDALPAELGDADKTRLQAAYREAIAQRIHPALARLRDFLRSDYLKAGRTGAPGLTTLPGGASYYDDQLEAHTTLRMGANQIHALGLREVARIRRAMQGVRRQVGFKGTLKDFFEHLRNEPTFKPASKEALLQSYDSARERVQRELPRLFDTLPKSPLEVRPVPPEQEGSAGGAYYLVGTPDGSRPGVFYVNTSELPTRTTPRTTALMLHEGLPGHHLQASLAQEDSTLPPTLRFAWNTGYGEGWALYAEWLGHEMGLYSDPYQHYGQLDMEIFRAVRLVVDTGLHAKGWSRERAVQYMLANTSLERGYIEGEVDRYIVWPGQATAYKIGEIKIKALRREAERALGQRFDVRAFHAQVLGTGAIPLAVLDMKIKDWIRSQR